MAAKLSVEIIAIDKVTKELNGISREFNSFQSKIVAVGRAMSGLFVGGAITSSIVGGLKELMSTSQEIVQVQHQLKESLGYTSIALDEQSQILSKKYLIDDDDIKLVQQQISNYTKSESKIKSLTDATINYAAATGRDLLSATSLVARAMETSGSRIRDMAGTLEGAAESTERLDSITEILNGHFAGQAEAVAKSKNLFQQLGYVIKEIKDDIAVGIFGDSTAKEALHIKKLKEEFESYYASTKTSNTLMSGADVNMALKEIDVYDKKISDAKAAALKEQKGSQSGGVNNKIKKTDLTGQTKEERKKAEAEAKQASDKQLAEAKKNATAFRRQIEKENDEEYKVMEKEAKRLEKIDEDEKDAKLETDQWLADERKKVLDETITKWEEEERQQEEHNNKMVASAMAMGTAYGNAIGNGISKGKDGLKDAYKEILTLTITYLENLAVEAVAANTLVNVASGQGLFGLITGAVEGGAITAVATAAKSYVGSFAMGTKNYSGGLALVGENGPELANLPRGTSINTTSETKQILNNSKSSGHTFHISINDSSGTLVNSLSTEIRSGTANVDRLIGAIMKRAGV